MADPDVTVGEVQLRAAPEPESADEERLFDRVCDLYLQNKGFAQIAADVGLPTHSVSAIIKRLRDEWRRRRRRRIEDRLDEELAKIDRLEMEYLDAWERSKTDKTTKTSGFRRSQVSQIAIAQQKTEQSTGNPAFLIGVQWCIEQRCKILGLYSPTRSIVATTDVETLTDEERAIRVSALFAKAQEIRAQRSAEAIEQCPPSTSLTTTQN